MDNSVIAGRYEIVESIGAGGSARVFRARDRTLGRDVAVKVLHHESTSDPAFVQRFRREARSAAALNHSNIVAIYDSGHEGDTYFIVMEFIDGQNLKEALKAGPFPEPTAIEVAIQVVDALGAAHERGIYHRDIKPQNVLLSRLGRVKVVDFGIARNAGLTQLTQANAVTGTAQYLSPEQALGKPADHRSDLYSLGIVLYEMLTGHEPFDGDSLVEVALQQVYKEPMPVRVMRPDISSKLEAVVSRALSKNPEDRFQSAEEMRTALEEARDALARVSVLPQPTQAAPLTTRVRARTSNQSNQSGSAALQSNRRSIGAAVMLIPLLLIFLVVGVTLALTRHNPTVHSRSSRTPVRQARLLPSPKPTRSTHRRVATPHRKHSPGHPQTYTQTATVTVPPPTLVPPTPVPPTAETGGVAVANAARGSPADTVSSFYQAVNSGQLSQAAALWTADMSASCNPDECIYSRFRGTRQIVIEAMRTSSLDSASGTATVDVTLQEYDSGSSQPRILSGVWNLVQTQNGWMLNRAAF